ncbi:MAG: VanZ family protein [Candidatus Poribacteria bacterium]
MIIFSLSSIPPKSIPDIGTELPIDKVVHFIEYGIFGFLLFKSLHSLNRLRIWQIIIIAIFSGIILGALDESYQSLTKRNPSIYDWLADVIGVVICMTLIILYMRVAVKEKTKEQ